MVARPGNRTAVPLVAATVRAIPASQGRRRRRAQLNAPSSPHMARSPARYEAQAAGVRRSGRGTSAAAPRQMQPHLASSEAPEPLTMRLRPRSEVLSVIAGGSERSAAAAPASASACPGSPGGAGLGGRRLFKSHRGTYGSEDHRGLAGRGPEGKREPCRGGDARTGSRPPVAARATRIRVTGPPRSSSQNARAKTSTLVNHTGPAAPAADRRVRTHGMSLAAAPLCAAAIASVAPGPAAGASAEHCGCTAGSGAFRHWRSAEDAGRGKGVMPGKV